MQPRERRRQRRSRGSHGLLLLLLSLLLLALAPSPAAAFVVTRPPPRRWQEKPRPPLPTTPGLRASSALCRATTTSTTTPPPTANDDGGGSTSLPPPEAAGAVGDAPSSSLTRVRRATRADLRRVAAMQVMEYGGKGLAFAWHYLQELDRLQTSFWVDPNKHAMLVIEETEETDTSSPPVSVPFGPLGAWLLGDPRVVGFVDLDARDRRVDRSTPDPYLSDLIIDPARRGQGLGRRLMAEAEAVAKEWGFVAVYLKVRASNARGRALYARLGYEVVGDGEDSVYTMRKWVVQERTEEREAEEKALLAAAASLMNPFFFDPAWSTGLDGNPLVQEEGDGATGEGEEEGE